MSNFTLRPMTMADRDQVAQLIHESTNQWYIRNGRPAIFGGDPAEAAVFFDVYRALDGQAAVVAERDGLVVGSCFYHPRRTHMSLGIMNVHPEHFGGGIARAMLGHIIDRAEERQLPLRLVSSAMNLDSFSLYTRAGFSPRCAYQDMILAVPKDGLRIDAGLAAELAQAGTVRNATPDDIEGMVQAEREIAGIERPEDCRYFIRNEAGFWHMSVCEDAAGRIDGFCASSGHGACNMVGPGVARTPAVAAALLVRELDQHRGRSPVFLVPVESADLVSVMYRLGARNCELHFAQVRGSSQPLRGVNMPTFLPESG